MDAPTRVMTALNHEEPDRVPAYEAFTNNTIMKHYGMQTSDGVSNVFRVLSHMPFKDRIANWAVSNKNFFVKGYTDTYEFLRRTKIDIGICLFTHFQRKVIKGGIIDEFGRIIKFEPYGKDGTVVSAYHGGYFMNFEEYESWERPDPEDPRRLVSYRAGKEVQAEMHNEIFTVPTVGGMMEPSWEAFGFERFSRILGRPKQAKKVFDDSGKLAVELTKILGDEGAELIMVLDDYGFKNGPFMSPKSFQTYVYPWLKRICDEAHKRGSKILLHSDGDLMLLFEDLVNCGIDAINPIEPSKTNPEYDIFKLYEKYGDKITFVGNISPIMLSEGTVSQVEEYSTKLILELAPGGGYIFSSGHSIPPTVTIENWKAVMRIREKYGTYPIQSS
ncbi:MAG: uroporphyrinogen decarboxylase family protein [Candidatus Thorarchaeota archaeon]|jgi:uroporphyrinogen decarboxylase